MKQPISTIVATIAVIISVGSYVVKGADVNAENCGRLAESYIGQLKIARDVQLVPMSLEAKTFVLNKIANPAFAEARNTKTSAIVAGCDAQAFPTSQEWLAHQPSTDFFKVQSDRSEG